MLLKPLYRLRVNFPHAWSVSIKGQVGKEDQVFQDAEGTVEGSIAGRFRGTDYPRRRVDGTVVTDLRAVIETTDKASILFECHGYGRTHTPDYDRISGGPRQWVATVTHVSDDDRYRWLNDTVCVGTGHSPEKPKDDKAQAPNFVLNVAELLWEPIPD